MEQHAEQPVAAHEHAENPDLHFEPQKFTTGAFVSQMLQGIGIALGLASLWVMETVRNAYFRLLDRMNVKPHRSRKISPFPPGKHPRPHPEPGV